MIKKTVHGAMQSHYSELVESYYYLALLISELIVIICTIIQSGPVGIILSVFQIVTLVGLFMAKNGNSDGIKMTRVCMLVGLWVSAILSGISTVYTLDWGISIFRVNAFVGILTILMSLLIFAAIFGVAIFYYYNISKILKDVLTWFRPEVLNENRWNCRLSMICIFQIIVNGLILFGVILSSGMISGSLSSMMGAGFDAGYLLNSFLPHTSLFFAASQIASIIKSVCIIKLYKSYSSQSPVVEMAKIPAIEEERTVPVQNYEAETAKQERNYPEMMLKRTNMDGKVFYCKMKQTMTVGRNPDCDIVVSGDDMISRQHLEMSIENYKLFGVDHSRNGILINGKKVNGKFQIHRGDQLTMGKSCFTVDWKN